MWNLVVSEKGTNVSMEPAASIFRDLPNYMTSHPEDCILDHIKSGNDMTKLNSGNACSLVTENLLPSCFRVPFCLGIDRGDVLKNIKT
jgi:hypothetical protein